MNMNTNESFLSNDSTEEGFGMIKSPVSFTKHEMTEKKSIWKFIICCFFLLLTFVGVFSLIFWGIEKKAPQEEYDVVNLSDEITSPFGSNEYDCTGSCYCYEDPDEERRNSATLASKGLYYTVLAVSMVMAIEFAEDFFHEECKTYITAEDCNHATVESRVESCDKREIPHEEEQGEFDKFELDAIGVIHTPYKVRKGMPVSQIGAIGTGGVIEIFPSFAPAIEDLEGFSHIYVTFIFHQVKETMLKVNPIFDGANLRGILSTRAPMRPNRIGMSLVEILKVEGNEIHIDGIDAVDGTPVVDIKPYLPDFENSPDEENVRTGWWKATKEQVKKKKFKSRIMGDD